MSIKKSSVYLPCMEQFLELKKYFEGKTVLSVDPPEACEAIAKFTMTDGTAFRLHATDLGYWVEDTIPKGSQYSDFNSLFTDFDHHQYKLEEHFTGEDVPAPVVTVGEGILRLVSISGQSFEVKLSTLSAWERAVCEHPEGIKLLTQASQMGDLWRMVFCRRDWNTVQPEDRCPEVLRLPWEDA